MECSRSTIAISCLLFASTGTPTIAAEFHVDADAPPGGNGAEWTTAFNHLQDALDAAQLGGHVIFIAEGTYRPDLGDNVTPGDRSVSFVIADGNHVLGGHAGYGAPDPYLRDPDQFVTILSGDLDENDGPDFVNDDENSYHVVTIPDTDPQFETLISGVTISGAHDDSSILGGAVIVGTSTSAASPRMIDCDIVRNRCNGPGAGVHVRGGPGGASTAEIRGCLIEGNHVLSTYSGGGLYSNNAKPRVLDTVVRDNHVPPTDLPQMGGGMHLKDGDPRIVSCFIEGNSANAGGGVAFEGVSGSGVVNQLQNCVIVGNDALYGGGGVYVQKSTVRIANVTIAENHTSASAPSLGGGGILILPIDEETEIVGCILWNNTSDLGDGHQVAVGELFSGHCNEEVALIHHSDVEGGETGIVGCLTWDDATNIDADPLFDSPGYRLGDNSPCIDAGDDAAVDADEFDVDDDMDVTEPAPDADLLDRIHYIVDMGAYERGCPGDIDESGETDFQDLLILLAEWGPCAGPPSPCDADVDGDGDVGFQDLLLILTNWGPCSAPGTVAPPQSITDCLQQFSNPEHQIKCIEAMILAGTP